MVSAIIWENATAIHFLILIKTVPNSELEEVLMVVLHLILQVHNYD